jgi:hypothetical protein
MSIQTLAVKTWERVKSSEVCRHVIRGTQPTYQEPCHLYAQH